MTTFGWKRKAGQNILKDVATKFSSESEKEEFSANLSWVQSFKRKKSCLQENCRIKCDEFKSEGIKFAESQRFQEAVMEFDKALNLVPDDYKILEMKAQSLLQSNSPFPAIQAAEKATKINPQWWVAFQTLGRSQLGVGDIEMAKRSFSKAIHLNPSVKELWEEDLRWTIALIKRKNELNSKETPKEPDTASEIVLDDEGYILNNNSPESDVVQCRF